MISDRTDADRKLPNEPCRTALPLAGGMTATLKPADNSAVKGALCRSGYSGNTGVFFATSTRRSTAVQDGRVSAGCR